MDYEIKDVYGVVTVNPKDQKPEDKKIRFITSGYDTLFYIYDGDCVIVTDKAGRTCITKCQYLDSYHFLFGKSAYHICEFAEWIEATGAKVEPYGGDQHAEQK